VACLESDRYKLNKYDLKLVGHIHVGREAHEKNYAAQEIMIIFIIVLILNPDWMETG